VVYTGHKNTLLEQQCLQAGADAMVVKGGEIEELTAALRRAAQQSRVSVRARERISARRVEFPSVQALESRLAGGRQGLGP
jgi:DNA-binding NarL/FixJ family response regulator